MPRSSAILLRLHVRGNSSSDTIHTTCLDYCEYRFYHECYFYYTGINYVANHRCGALIHRMLVTDNLQLATEGPGGKLSAPVWLIDSSVVLTLWQSVVSLRARKGHT